jgi:hypothetical protein
LGSHDLIRQTDNLHESVFAQLTSHRSEDTRATGVSVVIDDDNRIAIEADVSSIEQRMKELQRQQRGLRNTDG